jgi:hypothetical protein
MAPTPFMNHRRGSAHHDRAQGARRKKKEEKKRKKKDTKDRKKKEKKERKKEKRKKEKHRKVRSVGSDARASLSITTPGLFAGKKGAQGCRAQARGGPVERGLG